MKLTRRQDVASLALSPKATRAVTEGIRELVASLDASDFKVKYLQSECFSKYLDDSLVPPVERRLAAIQKWVAAEAQNYSTNQRLYLELDETNFGWATARQVSDRAAEIVRGVLGTLDYPRILMRAAHTNGASTRVRRGVTAAVDKLTEGAHCSESARSHWERFSEGSLLEFRKVVTQDSSVLFTVPKKSDIDRVCCKEPECNMALQRSVGLHIRERLKRVGVDLNDQSVNRGLAQRALKAKLATIDLSSASDTVSRSLVHNLLPWEWYSLLDALRVHSTLIPQDDGGYRLHELEMFSSMGNGFTFELESLIFYALTRAVCWLSGIKGRVSIYGDDIIAPVAIVRRLKRVFHYFGFTMNPKKTHFRDRVRESCGGHYYSGFDVTPFYVRKEVATIPELINLLNSLLEWDGRGWGFFLTEECYKFWSRFRRYVPRKLWGGINPKDPTCLVTGDAPRERLVPLSRERHVDQVHGCIHWLMNREQCDVFYHGRVLATERNSKVELRLSLSTWDDWFDTRSFMVDPQEVLEQKYRFEPLQACGERTSWSPGLIFEGQVT